MTPTQLLKIPTSTLAPTFTPSPLISTPISTPSPTLGITPFTPTMPPPDAKNLVINGSFTQGFSGWERILLDEGGHSETKIIPFQTSPYGRALSLYHSGPGGVYFRQKVDVPNTYLDFYVTFRSDVETSLFGDPTGIAEIILVYLDEHNKELGRTHLINLPSGIFTDVPCLGCPRSPQSSNTEKFIKVKNRQLYVDYHIDIHAHLSQELLGIDPSKVDKITLLLAVGTTADSPSSSLQARLIVTDLRLYPKP